MENFNPNTIPQIGAIGNMTQTPLNSFNTIEEKKKKITFGNEPNEVSGGTFFGKLFMGVIIGGIISAILFALLGPIGKIIGDENGNPVGILGVILAVVGFLTGMIGNMGCALLLNIFLSKRYYNLQKMLGLIFTSSLIIFILFIPMYFLFNGGITTNYTLCGVQIIFSFFITICLLDFLSQPNYAASSLMGNLLGGMIGMMIYLALALNIPEDTENSTLILLLSPSIIWYTSIFVGSEIRNAIYYKIFERGGNPFYLPSLAELKRTEQAALKAQEKKNEEINIEMN